MTEKLLATLEDRDLGEVRQQLEMGAFQSLTLVERLNKVMAIAEEKLQARSFIGLVSITSHRSIRPFIIFIFVSFSNVNSHLPLLLVPSSELVVKVRIRSPSSLFFFSGPRHSLS